MLCEQNWSKINDSAVVKKEKKAVTSEYPAALPDRGGAVTWLETMHRTADSERAPTSWITQGWKQLHVALKNFCASHQGEVGQKITEQQPG